METKKLRPKDGLIVRDPRTKTPLAKDGENKPWIGPEGRYWRRRINDGSVLEIVEKKPTFSKNFGKEEDR